MFLLKNKYIRYVLQLWLKQAPLCSVGLGSIQCNSLETINFEPTTFSSSTQNKILWKSVDIETGVCIGPNDRSYISGFVDNQVQSQQWLISTQFRFLWRSVEKRDNRNRETAKIMEKDGADRQTDARRMHYANR